RGEADRHGRHLLDGGRHRGPAARGGAGGVLRCGGDGGRCARVRRVGRARRGHGAALPSGRQGLADHGDVLEVAGIDRRRDRRPGARDPLPEASRALADLQREHAAGLGGHGAGRAGGDRGGAGAARGAVAEHAADAGRAARPRLRHRRERDAGDPGADRAGGRDVRVLEGAVRPGRVHESGDAAGGAGELVPAADQPDGDAHRRPHRFRPERVRPRGQEDGGDMKQAPAPGAAPPVVGVRGVGGEAGLRVERVRGRRELGIFLKLPWRIYAADPVWVPPLLSDQRKALDSRHPFHAHAEVACFLAWRGGEPVGRIAAIATRRYIEVLGDRAGFFGLFESVDDADVAAALLAAAEAWLRARGLERVVGPMNFSTNDELSSPGVLVGGFDRPPSIMMAHTPPYYAALLEGAGYARAKDLVAYWLAGERPPERLLRGI